MLYRPLSDRAKGYFRAAIFEPLEPGEDGYVEGEQWFPFPDEGGDPANYWKFWKLEGEQVS